MGSRIGGVGHGFLAKHLGRVWNGGVRAEQRLPAVLQPFSALKVAPALSSKAKALFRWAYSSLNQGCLRQWNSWLQNIFPQRSTRSRNVNKVSSSTSIPPVSTPHHSMAQKARIPACPVISLLCFLISSFRDGFWLWGRSTSDKYTVPGKEEGGMHQTLLWKRHKAPATFTLYRFFLVHAETS